MTPVDHRIEKPGLDMVELLSRVEGDYELLRDISDIFNEEFPKYYEILTRAVAANDLKQVQISAHTLKGMFSSLSFIRAWDSARRIEQMARGPEAKGIEAEIASLEQTAYAAQASLQRACTEASW